MYLPKTFLIVSIKPNRINIPIDITVFYTLIEDFFIFRSPLVCGQAAMVWAVFFFKGPDSRKILVEHLEDSTIHSIQSEKFMWSDLAFLFPSWFGSGLLLVRSLL